MPARIVWRDPATGERFETPVTGGHCKLQWKPDWAMRWVALGVDYEMAGKDLIDSRQAVGRDRPRARRRAAGGLQLRALPRREGPEDLQVEGQRPDDRRVAHLRAARRACRSSCSSKPREAKKLYFDVIPRHVDEYLQLPREAIRARTAKQQLGNPVWHIHAGDPPTPETIATPIARPHARSPSPAAQPRRGRQFRGSEGRAVGLPPPLCAGRLAGEPSAPRRAGRLRDRLFPATS